MALVTVQRAPSPRRVGLPQSEEEEPVDEHGRRKSRRSQRSLKKLINTVNTIKFVNRLSKIIVQRLNDRFSESYFTIKGAALILPKSDKIPHLRKRTRSKSSLPVSDIQIHLQSMFHELRQDDTIQVAIKLETCTEHARYLAIVVTDVGDRKEGVIIGFHVTKESAHLGLVLPINPKTEMCLDGDGGFRIKTTVRDYIFKPVSIQAMWSALMALDKMLKAARCNTSASTHQWVANYSEKITSDQHMINEWEMLDDLMVSREDSTSLFPEENNASSLEKQIRQLLREIMVGQDLEELTAYDLRIQLEGMLKKPLKAYKSFIDQEMLLIVRQLDAPSLIFDFMYLGSEWNASNLQELKANGVGYILNVTREIDNFYPGIFKYMNIRLYDNEQADLLRHWEQTHRFICKARDDNSKILIHCKMGVSRSASTVIAFAMKEYGWSLDQTIEEVRSKRNVIRPNDAFMQQLQTYEGILNASKQRWNPVFKMSTSADQSVKSGDVLDDDNTDMTDDTLSSDAAQNTEDSQIIDISASSQQPSTLDKESENIVTYDLQTSDSEGDQSDTDDESGSRPSSSSTVSYHLEQEGDDTSLNDDQEVFDDDAPVKGLSYTKLDDALNLKTPQISKTSPTPPTTKDPDNAVPVHRRDKSSSSCPNTPIEKRRKHTKSLPELNKDDIDIAKRVATPERKSMSPTHINRADEMLSVCEGVVQKTREQIAAGGIKSAEAELCSSSGSTEEMVPVTPGTVRKVLGQIESRDNHLLPRSSSFKMARRKCTVEVESLQRSASVRVKRARPIFPTSNLATHSTGGNSKSAGAEPSNEFHSTFSKIRQIPEDKVKFSIGAHPDSNAQSANEDSDNEELMKMPDIEDTSTSNSAIPTNIQIIEKTYNAEPTVGGPSVGGPSVGGATKADCMLKVASKPALFTGCEIQAHGSSSSMCSSPVPVRTLVGAFEDIGSATTLSRPLTIHVDSFSSDPFAQQIISEAEKSPLQRSQSLHIMETDPSVTQATPAHQAVVGERKLFEIKSYATSSTSSAQKILPPYWKIKRDNAKLVHSFSSAAVSSKDAS